MVMDNLTLIHPYDQNHPIVVATKSLLKRDNEPKLNIDNFLQTIGFILCGLPLLIINIPIFAIIITKQSLRINYMIMAFIILNNGLTGLNNIILGITRLVDLHRFTEGELIDNDRCLLHCSNFLVIFILLNGLGLLANSIDRILVVTFPIQYFRHAQLIAIVILTTIYTFAFIFMSIVIVIEIASPLRHISPLCLEQLIYAENTYSVILCVRTLAAVASIPLMIAVIIIMKRRQKTMIRKNRSTSFGNINAFIERQKSFTQTALLSCSITFFLFVVPAINQLLHDRLNTKNESQMALYAVFLTSINSYNLAFIFVHRQRDVRLEVIKVLTCCYPRNQSINLGDHFIPKMITSGHRRSSVRFFSHGEIPVIRMQPITSVNWVNGLNTTFSRRLTTFSIDSRI